MSKKKKESVEAIVVRSRDNKWNVSCEGNKLGKASNLLEATSILYDNGYKSHAFRRGQTASGKPMFHATVLKFDKEKSS